MQRMRFLLVITMALSALLLTAGCAAQKSAKEMQEEAEALRLYEQRKAAVNVTKVEPSGCKMIQALQIEGWNYENAIDVLKGRAAGWKANTVVIDGTANVREMGLSTFQITARLFLCP